MAVWLCGCVCVSTRRFVCWGFVRGGVLSVEDVDRDKLSQPFVSASCWMVHLVRASRSKVEETYSQDESKVRRC